MLVQPGARAPQSPTAPQPTDFSVYRSVMLWRDPSEKLALSIGAGLAHGRNEVRSILPTLLHSTQSNSQKYSMVKQVSVSAIVCCSGASSTGMTMAVRSANQGRLTGALLASTLERREVQ